MGGSSGSKPPTYNGPGDRATPSSPSTPSTPAPGAPATPAASGPSTPTATPPPRTPATGSGYVPKVRGPSTREELRIQWDHPVPPRRGRDGTLELAQRALPLEEALAAIRRDDPRPLLVVRECARCAGTEDALLSRVEDNERTFLMSRWFHCVKLPPAVTEPDHPFHALFAGKEPPHLFVSRTDGSLRHDLIGMRSLAELWGAMRDVLATEYRDDAGAALGKLAKILDRFDELDAQISDVERRLELTVEEGGANAKKLEKLRGELSELRTRRDASRAEAAKISKLERREPKAAAGARSSG